MAQFKQWFTQDLTESIVVRHCESVMFTGDDKGAVVGVRLYDNGAAYSGGGTVTGAVKRSDGGLVALTGTLSGNSASVVIPAAALAYPGPIGVHIVLVQGGSTTTVLKAIYSVDDNGGAAVDPGTIIPSINDLITAINTAVASIPSNYSALLHTLAPDFNASTPYTAGNYVWYNGTLYRFTANHAAGSWAGTDAKAAVIGTDLSGLKSALSNTAMDVLPLSDAIDTRTAGGVTVTQIDVSTYHFQGTISASSFMSWARSATEFPSWLKKGKPYTVSIKGASANNNNGVYFDVIGYRNGSSEVVFLSAKYSDGYYTFVVPESFSGGIVIRAGWLRANAGHVVDETIEFHMYSRDEEGILFDSNIMHFIEESQLSNVQSCNDVKPGQIVFVSSVGDVLTIPDFPFNAPGTLACLGAPLFPVQYAFQWNTSPIHVKSRSKGSNGWTAWTDYQTPDEINSRITTLESKAVLSNGWAILSEITSCDDITSPSWYAVSSAGGVPVPSDFPFPNPGWLLTIPQGDNYALQVAFSLVPGKIKTRIKNGTWAEWVNVGGTSSTTTITQEVSRDTYNNTYNITTNPTITTDANGWLQPVDTNTGSETGKTDMTGPIMSMLQSTGYCHLAPGIYYVSGNIDMPAGSMIEGCGKQTIIRLLQSTTSGYIVRMHTRSTLKNVCLSGGYNQGSISDGNIGGRKGINYIGNRDGQSTGVTPATCTLCQIEGCWFENLDSGIYGYNAGGGLQEGLEVSNCYFTRCKAGINFDYWTEYSKFTNCVTFQCYYGCINNGGNNVFVNCTFHGVIGFLIDNSSGNKTNSAHGSVIGCTFNHIDNMNNPSELGKGIGIKVLNTVAGFIFANCQIWYGRIHIESSKGIQITGCEFGGLGGSDYPVIESSGSDMIFVDNCLFQSAPTLSISSPAKFTNCWTYSGTAVTP